MALSRMLVSRSTITTLPRRTTGCRSRLLRHNVGGLSLCSSSSTSSGPRLDDKRLKESLLLPRTTFPMRANAVKREPQMQERITKKLYREQDQQRRNNPNTELFTLHDGPPYANGSLHMGHFVNKVIKDIINRDKLMQGYRVNYVPGWDCHGLPIELKAVEKLKKKENTNSKDSDTDMDHTDSPAKLQHANEIRKLAMDHATETIEEQKQGFERWGVMADWDSNENTYRTMDASYEYNELDVFHELWKRGSVFRGVKPVYWSPSTQTALAEAELEYKDDHVSKQIYVTFPIASGKEEGCYEQKPWDTRETLSKIDETVNGYCRANGVDFDAVQVSAAIWTTTPWTIPANVAIAVSPEETYALLALKSESQLLSSNFVFVAESLQEQFIEKVSEHFDAAVHSDLICTVKGQDLAGIECIHPLSGKGVGCDRRTVLIPADYVTIDSGTGLVHTAPGHGVDDWKAIEALNGERAFEPKIPVICPVDDKGKYSDAMGSLNGKNVLSDGNEAVIDLLHESGCLLHSSDYTHRYPYDWRSKLPVIIRATSQWFINVRDVISKSTAAVDDIRLVPENGAIRLKSMLNTRTEWCISRQRPWGVPIPVLYHCDHDEPLINDESLNHIKELIAERGADVWWQASIEELLPPSLQGYENATTKYRRGMDTFDVWFDSGTSWASIWDRSSTSMDVRNKGRRSDVVVEGSDQHRGWFQSSLLISMVSGFGIPFSTIVTHGFVLDHQALKMSKSVGNVVAPADIIEGGKKTGKKKGGQNFTVPYGADVGRWWVASTDYSKDIVLSPAAVGKSAESLRRVRNTAKYLLSNLNGYIPKYFSKVERLQDTLGNDQGSFTTAPDSAARAVEMAWRYHAGSSPFFSVSDISPVHAYALNRIALLDQELQRAYSNFNFAKVVAAISTFVTNDMSSRYLEFVKDRLYCSDFLDADRDTCQAVILESLISLVNGIAPIACYTAEDVFQHSSAMITQQEYDKYDWPLDPCTELTVFHLPRRECPSSWRDNSITNEWEEILAVRSIAHRLLEEVRNDKLIGSPLEACAHIDVSESFGGESLFRLSSHDELANVMGTSQSSLNQSTGRDILAREEVEHHGLTVTITRASGDKCRRCWRVDTTVTGSTSEICARCQGVLTNMGKQN